MLRYSNIGIFAALWFSVMVEGADVTIDLTPGNPAEVDKALMLFQKQRDESIAHVQTWLVQSAEKGDWETAAKCMRSLGDLRANEAAPLVAKYILVSEPEKDEQGRPKVAWDTPPPMNKFWPAVDALTKMGMDGVRAAQDKLLDPKHNYEELVGQVAFVTRSVLGDFAADYTARRVRHAKEETGKERLGKLAKRLTPGP